MKRKLFVENEKCLGLGYMGDTSLQIEEYAQKNGLYFSEDDMGDCYLSFDEECEVFEEVEGFEF